MDGPDETPKERRLKAVREVAPLAEGSEAAREREKVRRVEALSLKLAGFSYDQIGERLGVHPSRAQQIVSTTLEDAENHVVEQMRDLEGSRLDRAQAAIWGRVLEGDLKAVDTFLRLSQRRSRLYGLDAPAKVEVGLTVRQEMEQALIELEQLVVTTAMDEVVDAEVIDDAGIEG